MATLPFTYKQVMRFCVGYEDKHPGYVTIKLLSSNNTNFAMYKHYLPKVEKALKEIQIRKLIGVKV